MRMAGGFRGRSWGSSGSRCWAPPLRLIKMQARAEPRGLAAVRLVAVSASARTLSNPPVAAPNRKCRRVTEACPPQVFQFWFICMASLVVESEVQLAEQRRLQITEPLVARAPAPLHHQA